jgi:transcriptional regulator with XRE-family HTH domain
MDILKELIQERKMRYKSQEKVALYLGVTTVTLNRYETRRREIPFNILLKYAEYLDYEVRILKKG